MKANPRCAKCGTIILSSAMFAARDNNENTYHKQGKPYCWPCYVTITPRYSWQKRTPTESKP